MNKSKILIGKYGEQLIFTKLKNNQYLFTCLEIGADDKQIDKAEYKELVNKYYKIGESHFDKQDRSAIISRSINLGILLIKTFLRYNKTKNRCYFNKIKGILKDIKLFKLNDMDYCDLFLTAGSTIANIMNVGENNKQIRAYIKFLKDVISKNQYEYLITHY